MSEITKKFAAPIQVLVDELPQSNKEELMAALGYLSVQGFRKFLASRSSMPLGKVDVIHEYLQDYYKVKYSIGYLVRPIVKGDTV